MVRRFEDILERVQEYNAAADLDSLRRAYVFSAREHRDQVRSSGEPYLVHPLEVAYLLAEQRLDVASIVAGLLHDVVAVRARRCEVAGEGSEPRQRLLELVAERGVAELRFEGAGGLRHRVGHGD